MSRKPVTLGEYKFESKKEAKQFFADILNAVPLGTRLSGEDFDYVLALLLNHPNASQKVGAGVDAIKVDRGDYAANRCFHVIRNDKTEEDFSIGKCIDGEHSDFHRLCVACRKAVEKDVRDFKQKYFDEHGNREGKVKCQEGGERISFTEAHVDHRVPFTFSSIVHYFVQAKGLDVRSVQYLAEGKYGNELADESLQALFRDWHKQNAKLRIIARTRNLRKGHLGRVASTKADGSIGEQDRSLS